LSVRLSANQSGAIDGGAIIGNGREAGKPWLLLEPRPLGP